MPTLDLDALCTLVAVADTGSFTRAAQTVHRSQSAVSMQIKAMETALGKPLFVRNTRHLTLTAEGHTLLGYARRMLGLHDEAWAAVVRPGVTGRVVVGVPDDYVSSLLPPVLRKFSVTYPRVEIEVICAQSTALAGMLANNEVDLACVTRDERLQGDFIRQEPVVWVAAPSQPPLWKLRPLPIAVYEHGSVARAAAIEVLEAAGIAYRTSYSSPSLLGLLTVVDACLAVAPVAQCSVASRHQILGRREGLPDLMPLDIVLVRSRRSNRLPCDALAEQMLEELRVDGEKPAGKT